MGIISLEKVVGVMMGLEDYIKTWKEDRYKIEIEVFPKSKCPKKAHPSDAGFDVYSMSNLSIKPGEIVVVPLGFRMKFSDKSWAQLCPKSGLSLKGLHVMAGVIDSEYRGEVSAVVINLNQKSGNIIKIEKGDKVAQLIMHPYAKDYFIEKVESIEIDTDRGEGGFNSTGDK